MHPQIDSIFDEAENRYLKPEELGLLSQYIDSLPDRLDAYRALRDKEIDVMQTVADQLEAEMPQEKIEVLERCIKNALLVLRCCSMGMLLNDELFVKERLLGWLSPTMKVYNTHSVDTTLYRLLDQALAQTLDAKVLNLFSPMLTTAKDVLLEQETLTAAALGW